MLSLASLLVELGEPGLFGILWGGGGGTEEVVGLGMQLVNGLCPGNNCILLFVQTDPKHILSAKPVRNTKKDLPDLSRGDRPFIGRIQSGGTGRVSKGV